MSRPEHDHWLVRPRTIRILWGTFAVILASTVAAQMFVHVKGQVDVDGWPAFGAWFGFGACLVMVLVAKVLGVVLKRPERYYGDADD